MIRRLLASSLILGLWSVDVAAQDCGGVYVIQRGDSLSRIAAETYRNAFRWTNVYQANTETIGPDPDKILAGQKIVLPCLDGTPENLAATDPVEPEPDPQPEPLTVELSALEGFPPFTDNALPGGGMISEIVEEAASRAFPAAARVNPRSVGALSATRVQNDIVPISFPWVIPDCPSATSSECEQVVLSDPMFEVLVVLFARANQPVALRRTEDLAGKVLCSASAYSTDVLNGQGRNWVADNLLELREKPSVTQCFEALIAGDVAAVVVNEFTGRAVSQTLGVEDQVEALTKSPLAIAMLHAGVPRTAPRANEVMTVFNQGLRALRVSGKYQSILDRHLGRMWQGS